MLDEAVAALEKVILREGLTFTIDKSAPMTIPPLIVKWRKRGLLRTADLTSLRLAYSRWGGASEFRKQFAAAVAERLIEREVRKDTPRG